MRIQQNSSVSQVPRINYPRSTFSRPKSLKTSFSSSFLFPIYCEPVLPGDTVNMSMSNFVRMNPTVAPFMDNIHIDTHFFFVPNRIVWDNWEKFLGSQDNPSDSIDYLIPKVAAPSPTGFTEASLGGYFGLQTYKTGFSVNVLPFRMYNMIYNQWFRAEAISDSAPLHLDNGPDPVNDYFIRQRNKFFDYFTSALPSPQRGAAVAIPSTFTTNVTLSGTPSVKTDAASNTPIGVYSTVFASQTQLGSAGTYVNTPSSVVTPGANTNLYTTLSDGTATLNPDTTGTINALRTAEAIQTYLERNNRGGTRYTEFIRSHFGVISPDARLQRPEYLGGNSVPLSMTPVQQTSETATTPQGNLAGMGTLNSHDARFVKSFTEHGYIIGLVSARSDIHYQQGCDRHWWDDTRFDFYVPALANLGDQAILNRELMTQGTSADTEAFGFIGRWDHHRYSINRVTGALNSEAPASLDYWHLAQDFPALPILNSSFIKDGTPEIRVLNVTNEPAYIGDFYFDTKWTRVMPIAAVPGIGVRF